MYPYSRQKVEKDDIKAVIKVLKSDFLTQGENVPKFEKAISKKFNTKYALATNSGTSALHVACIAIGLTKNDIVWTSANSFVASINCAKYLGAKVDFVDIDPNSYNLSVNDLKKKLEFAKKKKKLPKLIVVVHFAGQPADLKKIYKLSKIYKFKIIEDASHAIGAKYNGSFIGNCKYSNITVFSFHPVKIITSGEGGMCLTNNKLLNEKMDLLRTHGITKNKKKFFKKKNIGPWYYEQLSLGYNYRMSDIHAALGISQLKKLNYFVNERNRLAKNYYNLLQNLPITLPKIFKGNKSSFHLFVIKIKLDKVKKKYYQIFNFLRKKKIWVNLHYLPIYSQPFYRKIFKKKIFLKNTEKYYRSALSIPIYPGLKLKDQIYISKKLKEILL